MFAKVYQYKFGTVAEAKVAASFCADNLGKKISKYKFQSLNVMIGKEGDLSIFIKFDTIERLKKYEAESDEFIRELKQTFSQIKHYVDLTPEYVESDNDQNVFTIP